MDNITISILMYTLRPLLRESGCTIQSQVLFNRNSVVSTSRMTVVFADVLMGESYQNESC